MSSNHIVKVKHLYNNDFLWHDRFFLYLSWVGSCYSVFCDSMQGLFPPAWRGYNDERNAMKDFDKKPTKSIHLVLQRRPDTTQNSITILPVKQLINRLKRVPLLFGQVHNRFFYASDFLFGQFNDIG